MSQEHRRSSRPSSVIKREELEEKLSKRKAESEKNKMGQVETKVFEHQAPPWDAEEICKKTDLTKDDVKYALTI